MHAAFVFEEAIRLLAFDREHDLFVAAGFALALREQLDLHLVRLGVAHVHPREIAREDGRLVAAGSGANLDEDVLVVVGIARHISAGKRASSCARACAAPWFFFGAARASPIALAQQRIVRGDLGAQFAKLPIGVDRLFELRALFAERGEARLIEAARGIGQLGIDLVKPPRHRLEALDALIVSLRSQ